MTGDNLERRTYACAMAGGEPHLVLKIDTKAPIEIGAFVGAFSSLGNEYERYIKRTNPDLAGDADIYVQEVRAGCIEASLIPWLSLAAPFINDMDKVLIVEQFVRTWGARFQALLGRGGAEAPPPETRRELKDWSDAVAAVANDPNGSVTLSAANFSDGERKIRASFKFTTKEAREARDAIESKQRQLEYRENSDHERVLMRFTRPDIGSARIGKRSGERVRIEEISEKTLALVYGSELAEQRIKHEMREADDNIFKMGFVVDVNVRFDRGKPIAYAVTNVHQVIDLEDD